MSDRREASARSPGAANERTAPGPGSDRERVLLLECRLEQMQAALASAREEADQVRAKLADVAARETDHARRYCLIHEELAEARAEIAVLHRHLERSEALRAEIAGHLFEGGVGEDTEELIRLRRRALAEDQRALVSDRTVTRLRARVEELVASRETLLTRIAEWQQLIREDGPEAADLSEFLAELRREILDLERHGATSDAREAKLRERLALAGIASNHDGEEPEVAPEPEPPAAVEAHAPEPEAPAAVEAHAPEPEAPAAVEAHAPEPEAPAAVEADAPEPEAPPVAEADQPEPDGPVATDEPAAAAADVAPEAAARPEAASQPAAAPEPEAAPQPTAVPEPEVEAPAAKPSATSRTDVLVAELLDAQLPELRADLLLRLGRTGDLAAADTVRPWTKSSEPSVRAAAYEALGRLLEREPEALGPHLRRGLTDEDARVRRRVVLATATARGLDPHALLDSLREDPDLQVRRLIRQVLRQAPSSLSAPDGAAGPSVPNSFSRV
jgi:hypothetical protein